MKIQIISKALSILNKYIGEKIRKSNCLCYNITDITKLKYYNGNIILDSKDGTLQIDNFKSICERCNKPLSTINMDEFKKQLISIDSFKSDLFNKVIK